MFLGRRLYKMPVAVGLLALLAGCGQQPMADQPRLEPLEASAMFANQRGSRQPVEGTVPRGPTRRVAPGHSREFLTGESEGQPVGRLPAELTEGRSLQQVFQRGRERFQVFCAPCHDRLGTGYGMVVQRGYPDPPTFHSDRLRQAALGHFFQVMSNGKGRMPAYAGQIPPEDRWAIAAYVRVLQLSQHAPASELDARDLQALGADSATGEERP